MPQINNLLDQPIIELSNADYLKLRDLVEGGTLIVGGLGAGKSSTSLRQIFYGFLRAGLGALICTVKSEDTANYIDYAKECGRGKDLIVFSVESGLSFDPLAYLWANGRGARDVEAIIDFFGTLLSIGKQHVGVNNDRFWELAVEQVMRHAIHLIHLANEPLSIMTIYRAIQSFPSEAEQHETPEWQARSYTASLIKKIEERKDSLTEIEWQDLEVATNFVFHKWASLDYRTKSNIEATFYGMADKFTFSPFREMFSSGRYDFTPEQVTHEHKLIILDIPVLSYGRETSRLMQILVKLVFQRAWLRHPYKPGCCNGAAIIQDEFQMLMSKFENHFVEVVRSSCIAPLYITQGILNLAEEMGESQIGSKTKAFLNNLSIKIAHNSTCPDTCEYLANVIGKEYRYIDNFSAAEGDNTRSTFGASRQLVHLVEPIKFTQLAKPDAQNPYAQAIVWAAGKSFNATRTQSNPKGSNFLKVNFTRNA